MPGGGPPPGCSKPQTRTIISSGKVFETQGGRDSQSFSPDRNTTDIASLSLSFYLRVTPPKPLFSIRFEGRPRDGIPHGSSRGISDGRGPISRRDGTRATEIPRNLHNTRRALVYTLCTLSSSFSCPFSHPVSRALAQIRRFVVSPGEFLTVTAAKNS